jgi:GTPase SAR1 family protein
MTEAAESIKVCMIGEEEVGKQTLLSFIRGDIKTGEVEDADFVKAQFQLSDSSIAVAKVMCWSPDKHKSDAEGFFHDASALVFVFDISRPDTFERIDWWIEHAKPHVDEDLPTILIANKGDLEHRVSRDDIVEMAHRLDAPCFMTIANDGTNVREAIVSLLDLVNELQYVKDGCLPIPEPID